MATTHAEALKAEDDENAALRHQLAECQSTTMQQAADVLGRFTTTLAQRDAEIMAAGNENATLCQQLVECKALMKKNAGDAETQIAAITARKDADIEVCRQQARDQSASN